MEIRPKLSRCGFSEIRQRELGFSNPRNFYHRIGGSEDLLKRIDLYGKLEAHHGCVNTVHFNPSGNLLVSGSDDRQIIIWNWAAKSKILSYPSGHENNVFQARIMPFTDDRSVITSAADGQVRFGQILENGQVDTKSLAKHQGRVHKLAIEPGSPHIFYSCGEDGFVHHVGYIVGIPYVDVSFYQTQFFSIPLHPVTHRCVYCLLLRPTIRSGPQNRSRGPIIGHLLVLEGGLLTIYAQQSFRLMYGALPNSYDDSALIYEPEHLCNRAQSEHYFDLAQFDLRSHSATKLFSCSSLSETKHIRLNAIVIDPRNPNYFAVGGMDEYARIYDIRNCKWDASNDSDRPVNTFSPDHLSSNGKVHITGLAYSYTSELLVTYNDELVYLFQKDMGKGPNPGKKPSDDLEDDQPQVYTGHRNSQTVKGVCFFGPNDEYVVSGSDCGHIFIWKKKSGALLRMMVGDRRIVNCLESHPCVPVLATSGLEKTVKIWAPIASDPIPLPDNAHKIMEANRQGRYDRSRSTLTPDVIMHVLRLQRRQTLNYIERRYLRADLESDDDEEEREALILGISEDGDASEEGFTGNSRECNIS